MPQVQEAAMEEERRRKELDEQEARSQAAVARKEKDIVKKQMRKERKTLRGVAKVRFSSLLTAGYALLVSGLVSV